MFALVFQLIGALAQCPEPGRILGDMLWQALGLSEETRKRREQGFPTSFRGETVWEGVGDWGQLGF